MIKINTNRIFESSGLSKILTFLKFLIFGLIIFSPTIMWGKQIEAINPIDLTERALRFWEMNDHSVRIVALGSALIGLSCALMGSYVVTRRLSLFGDTLSHAVLPGIALGFMWAESKNNVSLMIGASIAGFLGISCISFLGRFTKISQDSALGIVLSGFYAVGICMLTRIQKMDYGSQAGLDSYLFGQVSALSTNDLIGIILALGAIIFFLSVCYKELLVTGFDPNFARSIRLPVNLIQYLLWMLLAFCVISSLQVIGVILASALLIIPAATASLLAKRMTSYLLIASLFGAAAGVGGAFLSFFGERLPTGPLIVLVSITFFLLVLFFRPKNGMFSGFIKSKGQSRRFAMENTLKAIYQVMESSEFKSSTIQKLELMNRRGISSGYCQKELNQLVRFGFATTSLEAKSQNNLPRELLVSLTPKGWEQACKTVRNHRLWELYLTNEARYAPDHVHEDAEKIEHVLGEDTVRKLERILSNPKKDPHGKLIPSLVDIQKGWLGTSELEKENYIL
ncbi:MAG: ABC transporter [Opitutae bacterium]|nr:ABC transporter [Opitutae bacterium]